MVKNGSFEEEYTTDNNYWGSKPSSVIKDNIGILRPKKLLDIGAGDGRNAIYLAQNGFTVTALDLAPTGLANLTVKAEGLVVDGVNTVCADFLEYKTHERFDTIITNFTIHFVGKENIEPFLQRMIDLTEPGGINIIDDFTQNGPLAKNHPENYLTEQFLHDFYTKQRWKIISSEARLIETKAFEASGEPYKHDKHEAVAFIAQKKVFRPFWR